VAGVAAEVGSPGVQLSIGECLDDELGALLEKLNIEASAFPPDVLEWIRSTRPEVRISCDVDALYIRVVDPTSKQMLEQRVDVDEAVASALSRYVALVVVELISAGGEGLAAPRAVPKPAERSPAEPEQKARRFSRLRLYAAPTLWLGGSPLWLSYGGSLGLELSALQWLVPTLDLNCSYGRTDVSRGEIGAVLLSGAPLVLFRFPTRGMSLLAGVGFRLGAVVWLGRPGAGEEAVGETATAHWNGPCVDLRASFEVSEAIDLGLNVEGGWLASEAHARVFGMREMSLAGGWVRVGLIGKMALL
jgi:hypothetical protein